MEEQHMNEASSRFVGIPLLEPILLAATDIPPIIIKRPIHHNAALGFLGFLISTTT